MQREKCDCTNSNFGHKPPGLPGFDGLAILLPFGKQRTQAVTSQRSRLRTQSSADKSNSDSLRPNVRGSSRHLTIVPSHRNGATACSSSDYFCTGSGVMTILSPHPTHLRSNLARSSNYKPSSCHVVTTAGIKS
ncbi:hypothetical protein M404DRAFT_1005392 [Pisolithus tinctorius Marx 270]|uniref:Uncharacterized protein n=1 Tax=Pisolithus tinctorius Marx 270 TaxID=870435 RepID=A0A0C3NSK7_PISTI|nr:hypothetical protein M404DRAFT_1005392 [Pisolithus tinctorius Marx 270]